MTKLFITATDTDAGKTYVSTALIHALVAQGKRVAVYKPVSAGCTIINQQLVNEDAQRLQAAANCDQLLSDINPIAFQAAIAPHIAAMQDNKSIELTDIFTSYQKIEALGADFVLTEGAGGWRLPLGQGKFLSDFAKASEQNIILVVNMKLGCLNHALLTYQAIIADGLNCIAWVANCCEAMPYLHENISALEQLLPIPKMAQLGFEPNSKLAAEYFDLSILL